ncbi:MAG: transporter substrate-binding domain-containing protein [Acidimicrobiia bacterium]|nr:transporter substrate-binding domain-containing protein [Acidimicrobiia bacterium]
MKKMIKWLVPVLALALVAAACGGDDGDGGAAPPPAPAPEAAATPAPADGGDAPAAPAEAPAPDPAPVEEEVTLSQGESGSAAQGVVSGNLLDEIKDRGTLRVGMVLQFEPQMYIDENGEPAGYDVDLMHMLADDLGVELEINDLEFDAMIPGVLARQFDLASVGLVGRPARLEQLWFTCPYVPYGQVVVVNNDSAVKTRSDLNSSDVTMTALAGSTAANLISKEFSEATLVELDQAPAFLEVASGRADAIVVENYLAQPFVAENPTTSILDPTDPFLAAEYGAFALPRGEVVWLEYLNGWLGYYIARGTLDDLYEKHIDTSPGMPACT